MTRLTAAFGLALLALLALAIPAAAHDAVPGCSSLTLTLGTPTADILRTDVDPDALLYDNVPGTGAYSLPAGTFTVTWSDGFVRSGVVVGACTQPTPSPTPTPPCLGTPAGCGGTPTPTPASSPSPTPSPSPSPTATPAPSPVPPTSPPDDFGPPPTLPPTDTSAGAGPKGPQGPEPDYRFLGWELIGFSGVGFFLLALWMNDDREPEWPRKPAGR